MDILPPLYAGLAPLAHRVDAWAVLDAVGASDPKRVDLRAAGLTAAQAARVARAEAWVAPRPGIGFLHAGMAEWPAALRRLPLGAVSLSWEGNPGLLREVGAAVVGARACTTYGREHAARLARAVVDAGAVVISGLASGIDLAAHQAAGGRTIAVLGQGLDTPMPGWQRRARDALLAAGGLVLSEFHPAFPPDAHTFPIRNRILAGLARAVVVVEAGERSGARSTAAHGLRLGREVLAVPGPLDAPASVGCLDLIEEGATVVRGPHTLLAALRVAARAPLSGVSTPVSPAPASGGEGALLALLDAPRTPEELREATGLGWSALLEALGLLELTGRVSRLPGRRYQAVSR